MLGLVLRQVIDEEQRHPEFFDVDTQCLQGTDNWLVLQKLFFGKWKFRHIETSFIRDNEVLRACGVYLILFSILLNLVGWEHGVANPMYILVNIHRLQNLAGVSKIRIFSLNNLSNICIIIELFVSLFQSNFKTGQAFRSSPRFQIQSVQIVGWQLLKTVL